MPDFSNEEFKGHSPAPWRCVEGVLYDSFNEPIAEVISDDVEPEYRPREMRSDVNARLLAAAPELLERVTALITENGLLREALNLAANGDRANPVVAARLAELLAEVRRG